jgi:hypothetical protein
VCAEIAKTSAFGVSLASLIGKSYDFAVYRVVQGFFPGGIRLKMRFGTADSQLDASDYCSLSLHGDLTPFQRRRRRLKHWTIRLG